MATPLRTALCCVSLAVAALGQAPNWFDGLPAAQRQSILWRADHEDGTLADWDFGGGPNAGGGIFNTGGAEVWARSTSAVAHSGSFSAENTITNAYRAQNGSRATRMMRWTNTHWHQGGQVFPMTAYYSTWVYFPTVYNPNKYAPWDPGDGGWWNIFQFKANDAAGESQPIFTLNVEHNDARAQMELYLYAKNDQPGSHGQATPVPLPVGEWVHLEARYVVSPLRAGRITVWQDGVEILDVQNTQTVLPSPVGEYPIWGIGNYTDHIAGGTAPGRATIYFDDAAVSTARLSEVIAWRRIPAANAPLGLDAHGSMTAGSRFVLRVEGAGPAVPTALLVGRSRLDLPLFGGVLVPSPLLTLARTASTAGAARWEIEPPVGLAPNEDWFFQCWALDAGAPFGLIASDGFASTTF